MRTPGAIGLFDQGAIVAQGLAIKILAFEGVTPSEATMSSGKYPFFKDLSFVCVAPPKGAVARFLAFVYSPAGQGLIRRLGYIPQRPGRR